MFLFLLYSYCIHMFFSFFRWRLFGVIFIAQIFNCREKHSKCCETQWGLFFFCLNFHFIFTLLFMKNTVNPLINAGAYLNFSIFSRFQNFSHNILFWKHKFIAGMRQYYTISTKLSSSASSSRSLNKNNLSKISIFCMIKDYFF